MVDVSLQSLANGTGSKTARTTQDDTEERLETRMNYQELISDLHIHKPEYTEPSDQQLFTKLDRCNDFFKEVRTPREGVLDAVALKTISSFARIQTVSIDKKSTTEDAFRLMRQCGKIVRYHFLESDDILSDFYLDFCHCHKNTSMMNFMSGRLPTFWFVKHALERSILKERTRRPRETIDYSQRTQIVHVTKMSTDGEQTSKEIIRIHRCLQTVYEANQNQPISFFLFAIHPTRFSRSVENIFHISFLIKEGKAELFLDENQLPVLRPVTNCGDDSMDCDQITSTRKSKPNQMHCLTQLILSLDMEQWESLVEVFQIANAMISDQ